MLLVCVAAVASPPASASLRSCSAIGPCRRCLPPLCPPEPRRVGGVGEAVASFLRWVALQRVEGAGGETLTTINDLRLPLFRPLAPPGGRRLSPSTPRVFANIFVCACSLCLPPSQLEKGNGVLKDLEQPAKANRGGGWKEAV